MLFWEKMCQSNEFSQVMKSGRKKFFPSFIIFSTLIEKTAIKDKKSDNSDRNANSSCLKLGIIASKKVGGAVSRNRCKRRVREIVRGTLANRGVYLLKKGKLLKNNVVDSQNINCGDDKSALKAPQPLYNKSNRKKIPSYSNNNRKDSGKKILLMVIVVRKEMLLTDYKTLFSNLKTTINQQIAPIISI